MQKIGMSEDGGYIVKMNAQEWQAIERLVHAYGNGDPHDDMGWGLLEKGVDIRNWLDAIKSAAHSLEALNEIQYHITGIRRHLVGEAENSKVEIK